MVADPLRYHRRFALAGALLTLVEAAAVGLPLVTYFSFDGPQRWLLRRAGPIALGGAWLIWWVATRAWRAPLDRAVRRRRAGEVVDGPSLQAASATTMSLPRRSSWLRAGLALATALFLSSLLTLRAGFPARRIATVAAVVLFHLLLVEVFRVLAWARILDRVRTAILPDAEPLRLFHQLYRPRLVRAGLATAALGVVATAAFTFFFLPINLEHYVDLETWFPLTVVALAAAWLALLGRLTQPVERYLIAATSPDAREHPARNDPRAAAAYRAAQRLPYELGLVKLALAVAGEALLAAQATLLFAVDLENAVLMFGAALVVTVGAALYEVLWHRITMRPLLAHLAARHRPAPDSVRTPLSLRTKMLTSFGVLTFFACGLSLFLSFVQYKTLATTFIQRETELRRDRILSDLRTRAARAGRPLAPSEIAAALAAEARDEAVIYYLPPATSAELIKLGGGVQGPPDPPAMVHALMMRLDEGQMELSALHLTGAYARLYDDRHDDLGAVAVLYPGYRGRGASIEKPIKVLLFFFVLLAIASLGIVVLVANDLTRPIRLLERRADAMAKGDLSRPVVHVAGEADEVGRLTFAFEEMRRALNEKLRSSTEINLSLEQEVTRRTAELERRNRELKDALDALRRAQAELVRSEKMASMGRLVAGIAHEINNPVNALVNSTGPLESTLEELLARADNEGHALDELAGEAREMLRVIRSGVRRTKEIVQALHNYSRGDDDRLVEVDLHRGLDESLDLLRHHLRHGIHVERSYHAVGRVRGYSGQLQQVFMNLLTNAAQALGEKPDGGTIRITTERRPPASAGQSEQVVITVADDGPGIPPEVLPRIFDPFFTTKDVGQGSGLGLSIVHGIVERHGGSISVESEVGKGTTFTVTLPAEAPERERGVAPRKTAEAN
jgi:signal transduction histidine kinase